MITSKSGPLLLGSMSSGGIRSPLVGRGPEMRELEEALGRALDDGQPQAVTIIGSAGIGKTRLLHEFIHRLRERERRVRVYRGLCRENGAPFGIVQRILRARFGIIEGADPAETRETFRKTVSEALGDRRVTEFLHFLGAFLDLKFPESPFIRAVEEDPQQFALISRAVLRRFFEVDAEKSPIVLTFEDLHWAQDDSLGLVQYLIESLADAPILILCTARPELLARRATFPGSAGPHRKLELAPLSPDDAAQLTMNLLAPTGEPPDELVDAAVEMAGGSPYLLEQMVRAFHDNGALTVQEDGSWIADTSKLEGAQLPLSVDDAITARISSLAPAERDLLEMASTMGGVFWLGALVALSRIDKPVPNLWGGHESAIAHIREMLDGLAERDYLLELPDASLSDEREYAFKHNLERETLHRLTNRTRLRRFHLVVGEWLEFRLAERAEEQCEMLAQHFEEGGMHRKAAGYYLTAADKARARWANVKAAEYYSRGLELLGDEDTLLRIEGLHHYGDVLQLAGQNDQAKAVFLEMLHIAFKLDLKPKGGAAHNRLGRLYRAVGQLDEAMRHLGTAHALFDAAGDLRGVASSFDDVGKVHWMRGDYDAAERFMRQALELRQSLDDKRSIGLSYNNLGLVYQDSGRFGEAQEAFQEALLLRREIDDKPGIAQTLNNLGTIQQDSGDHDRAARMYEEALAVAREVGDRMRQAVILTNLGESNYRRHRPADAIRVLQQAEVISRTLGDRILEGEILRGLGKAHMLVHDLPVAREYIARSIALFENARGKPFLGVALRTQAEVFAAAGWGGGQDHDRARASFQRAIELFDELGNEVELATTCQRYADFLESSPDAAAGPALAEEAASLRARADAIRERQRSSEEYDLPPLEGEPTHPGV